MKVAQSCLTLFDPMDYTVLRILQSRILEWVAFLFSRGSSQPRDWTQVSRIAGGFFTNWAIREAQVLSLKVFVNSNYCSRRCTEKKLGNIFLKIWKFAKLLDIKCIQSLTCYGAEISCRVIWFSDKSNHLFENKEFTVYTSCWVMLINMTQSTFFQLWLWTSYQALGAVSKDNWIFPNNPMWW